MYILQQGENFEEVRYIVFVTVCSKYLSGRN